MTSNHLLRARRLLWVCGAALGLVIELADYVAWRFRADSAAV